jgi:hypothetical protein
MIKITKYPVQPLFTNYNKAICLFIEGKLGVVTVVESNNAGLMALSSFVVETSDSPVFLTARSLKVHTQL